MVIRLQLANARYGVGASCSNFAGVLCCGAFKKVADILPFWYSAQTIRVVLSGNFGEMLPHLIIVLGYPVAIFILAIIVFQRKMSGEKLLALNTIYQHEPEHPMSCR